MWGIGYTDGGKAGKPNKDEWGKARAGSHSHLWAEQTKGGDD